VVAFVNSISTHQEELVITEEAPRVPHHVEDAVATIAALHAAHHREARALQKAISRATSGIAQPGTLILITLAIAIWVTFNLALPEFGRAALDPFPFPLLATIVSTIALYLATMILMTQRHDDEMGTRREQITLELAILSEQKSSKIIALLEEFRHNDPNQAIIETKWRRHWQSQPMRRLCSTRSKRRKKRIASKKAVDPFLRPQISIQRRQGGLNSVRAADMLVCPSPVRARAGFKRIAQKSDQTAHPGSLLPSINRRCFNLWANGTGVWPRFKDPNSFQRKQPANDPSLTKPS
jgi:uncharacterized membrane protein